MTVSELMRSGASAFEPAPSDIETLAQAARESAERSIAAMSGAMAFVKASQKRIVAMETEARAKRAKGSSPAA